MALTSAVSFGQTENLRLDTPLIGKTETGLTDSINPRKSLGYEGTPLAAKKNEESAKKPKGQTEITALEATFDQKTREAVFLGEVFVKDPEFSVNCDRLTAYLKKVKASGERPAASPPPANPAPGSARPGEDAKGGGLDRAVAEASAGNVVVITQDKLETDGSVSQNIGKGRKATYDATSGNIVLTGMPSVQSGINLVVATDESTVMILNRNGKMKVDGPHRSVIKDTSSETLR